MALTSRRQFAQQTAFAAAGVVRHFLRRKPRAETAKRTSHGYGASGMNVKSTTPNARRLCAIETETHRHIRLRTNCHTMADLVRYAICNGIIPA
jgi:hypothetical protein